MLLIINIFLTSFGIHILYGKAYVAVMTSRIVTQLVMLPIQVITIYIIEKFTRPQINTYIFTNNEKENEFNDWNKKLKIEKNKLLENIQTLQKCDIKIPDIIQVILRLKEKGQNVNLEEWTIQEMIDKIVRLCKPWRMCLNYYFSLHIL